MPLKRTDIWVTTAPVLVLNGASVINLEQGSSYTEQGATASDNIDGDITSSITIGGDTVNTSVVGTYNVVYSVSDTAGNSSQETRTVNVSADATIPVITLIGSSEVNINVGDVYSDAGATAQDNFDGDLTNDIVTNNSVDTSVAGSYTVTYNVNDAAGNSANEVVRLINVFQDTTAPVLVLNGASVINLEQGSSYTEQGATASDNIDGDITSSITIGGDTVNTSVVGTYNVVYSVSDTAGNSSQETRTVNVSADATIPVITLIGSSEVNINVGDVYSDAGATAQDNFDGDLTNDIVTNNSVDTSVAGSYTVTYNVNDAAGNSANEVVRLINVSVQPTGPVVLNEGYFESGWDGWSDGGSDCARRANSSYSYENNYSIRIRDNSGVGSSMTLSNVDLSPYAQVEVDFYFYVRSMENNEDFWLRYYNGSNWTTVATWTRGTDIENNTFYNATIVLSASQFNFANNSGFRFQNDASGNNDQIWIDQVTISGISSTSTIQNSIIPLGTGNTGFASNESDFEDLDVVIYPNPVSGNNLNVVLLDYNGIYYRVMNMLGQTVDSGQLKNRQVNVENLESGMYFIEINDGEEVFIKKFIRR